MGSTTGTRWLDHDQQKAWRAYIVATQLLIDRLDRELRAAHGISFTEYEILVRLSEAEDRKMRMALLADSLCHSRSRVTHTVTRMEKLGLLRRTAATEDGRGVVATMTDKGYATLERAAHTHVEGVRRHLLDLISDQEFAAVGSAMDTVADHLLAGFAAVADIRTTAD